MLFVLFLFVLVLALAAGAQHRELRRQQRRHDEELRQAEARWAEKLRALEVRLSAGDPAEDLRNLAAMIDGVASAGIRIEQRVADLEAAARDR